jgi:hypothetical protein
LVALASLYAWYQAGQDKFALELAKAVLQILVVVVLGTMATLLTGEFSRLRAQQDKEREAKESQAEKERDEERRRAEKERDEERRRAENLDELRKDLLRRLHQAYSDFKRTKRLLRAQATTPSYYGAPNLEAKVNLEQYDQHLQVLNDIQLDLEHMAKEAEANYMAFAHSQEIADGIRLMEKRLNKVVKEYESKRGNYASDNPPIISDLPGLRDIMGRSWQDEIIPKFTAGYKDAVEHIQEDIVRTDP